METILIASGDIFRTRYLKQLLEKDYRVLESSREGPVLDRLSQGIIDLLILDSQLEVGESISVISRINDAGLNIPVIMLVQSSRSPLAKKAADAGVVRIVRIPFTDQELFFWIKKGLEDHHDQTAPPSPSPKPEEIQSRPAGGALVNQPAGGQGRDYYFRILRKFTAALDSVSQLDRLLAVIGETVQETFDVRKVSLLLFQPEAGRFSVGFSSWMDSDYRDKFFLPKEKGLAAWMNRNQRIIRPGEFSSDRDNPLIQNSRKDLQKLQAELAIPLLAKGRLVGFIACGDRFTGERFTSPDLKLFSILSTFFALAITNALNFKLIRRQKDISQTIVQNLPTGIITLDQTGSIISINQSARDILGLWEKNLLYKNISRILPLLEGAVRETLRKKRPIEKMKLTHPVNGHPLLISTALLQSEQLGVIWINLIVQDIFRTDNAFKSRQSEPKNQDG